MASAPASTLANLSFSEEERRRLNGLAEDTQMVNMQPFGEKKSLLLHTIS